MALILSPVGSSSQSTRFRRNNLLLLSTTVSLCDLTVILFFDGTTYGQYVCFSDPIGFILLAHSFINTFPSSHACMCYFSHFDDLKGSSHVLQSATTTLQVIKPVQNNIRPRYFSFALLILAPTTNIIPPHFLISIRSRYSYLSSPALLQYLAFRTYILKQLHHL